MEVLKSGSEAGPARGLLRSELSRGEDRFIALYKGVPVQVPLHVEHRRPGYFIPLWNLVQQKELRSLTTAPAPVFRAAGSRAVLRLPPSSDSEMFKPTT